MAEITIEEAWAICPEAMVAWDKNYPDLTVVYISAWHPIHTLDWGILTMHISGKSCLDYHPDLGRWIDNDLENVHALRKSRVSKP